MRYLPHTNDDIKRALGAIGVDSIDQLFAVIPEHLRLTEPLDLPAAMDEESLVGHMESLAKKNCPASSMRCFLGGGVYDHHIPRAIDHVLARSEFYTAYTPYQPEISQGTLQAIFEYQTMVSRLLDMDIANASMYDGASAAAEAVLMSLRVVKRRREVVLAGALHPEYRDVIRTYVSDFDIDLVAVEPGDDGTVSPEALAGAVSEVTAAVVVQHPNFFGCLEELEEIARVAHDKGAILIVTFSDPTVFGVLKPPGSFGADIVAGEGQSLGIPMSLGGPGVGIFTARAKSMRAMPGRLVGKTVDAEGTDAYVLTLATREQHIRRERATSNICTNHGLMALAASVYLSLMGPKGLERVATTCHALAEELKARIAALDGFSLTYEAPTFHEFVVTTPVPAAQVVEKLRTEGILAGLDLGRFSKAWSHHLLVTVTERRTMADLESYLEALKTL